MEGIKERLSDKVTKFNKKEETSAKQVEVVKRVGTKEELAQLYTKLAKATAEIETVEKNGYNEWQHYEYAKADDIYKAVSKVLAAKYNVQIITAPAIKEVNRFTTSKGVFTEVFLKKYFSFNDGDTGAYIAMHYWGYDVGKSGKFLYKAYTGCMKYFLKDNFMIDTGDPDPESVNPGVDENTGSQENKQPTEPKKTNFKKKFSNEKRVKASAKSDSDKSKSENKKKDKKSNSNENLVEIKQLWKKEKDVVKEVAFEFLKEKGKEGDLSKLSEFKDEELAVVVERINEKLKEAS